MLRKIEKLRKESKTVRNRYAFWSAFLFTVMVTVFWASSLPARMSVFTGAVPAVETKGGFARMWQNMKASVSDSLTQPQELPVEEEKPVDTTQTWQEFVAERAVEKEGVPNPILIGTSSVEVATSTEE